ncbi:hypothetical protein J6590_014649 [Homalodisca vitripennis]|nr:hypothetical protein J6590_014649 [Homalodisca vitripennis]
MNNTSWDLGLGAQVGSQGEPKKTAGVDWAIKIGRSGLEFFEGWKRTDFESATVTPVTFELISRVVDNIARAWLALSHSKHR